MKKRLLALFCMITCIFMMAGCGSEKQYTTFEQKKLDMAEDYAADLVEMFANGTVEGLFDETSYPIGEMTMEEIETLVYYGTQYEVVGNAVPTGISSFNSAKETIGEVINIGNATAEISGHEIVVFVEVNGTKKNAKAEVVFTNDLFQQLKSISLNPVSTLGDLMAKAGMNTLIGMSTVFMVLILICLIISCFKVIPALQKKFADKKAAQAPAPVVAAPAAEETVDETDDLELVAVIAAAIAASEGRTSTDGFVVRSIIRR